MRKMYPENDLEFREEVIKSVDNRSITGEIGSLWVGEKPPFIPKVGMVARYYGRGLGFAVRGLFIDGIKFWYRTAEQEEQKHKEWVKNRRQEQKESFKNDKAELDKKYNDLPEVFQRRLDRFRKGNKDFRWEYEAYEMSCCIDAVKVANQLKTVAEIDKWSKLDWKEQTKQVGGLFEGHSGNSFDCTVLLAKLYLDKPDLVEKCHGALTPLVGCESYGCTHEKGKK